MPAVVLVHGFWHGSWCWSLVTEQLAARGIPSVAVDLDGHGLKSHSPASRWGRPFDPAAFAAEPSGTSAITASSAALTLVRQIRGIGGGEPCVIVAHSMGGAVATAAAELEPSLFARLVYVSAFAPVNGSVAEYSATPENEGETYSALLVADPLVVGAARLDTGDLGRYPATRETFYGDVDAATAEAAISLLQPDGPIGIPAESFPVTAGRYGTIPHSYVVCTKDNAIPVALQRRFVAEIDAVSAAPTAVTELDSSHSPFLSQPAALAAIIAGTC
jgi:pimeloyl-ACP methyl ester carboxylesterase